VSDGAGGPPPIASKRLIGELRVIDGPDTGRMFALGEETVLGRDDTADIVLEDPSGELSRRHARVGLTDGAAVVEDLGSTNGTLLNGERISGSRPLRSGDQIRIGQNALEFAPIEAEPAGSEGELVILSGPGAGTKAAVIANSATIGRAPECDLQVLDSEVSRLHAKVSVRDGVATIDDLHSSNGTYVDGERILERTTLAPGDRIQIGEATIELTSPVFAGQTPRVLPPQVSGVREVISQSSKLLTAESGTRKWWTLAVVLITVFMLLLDVTIVAVALPTISGALHPSFSSLQWIVDAYALMLTSVLLAAGSMADIFGRKRVLTVGLIIFTVASVVCAQAPNATVLDFARGVQGIGGATMFACSLALIVQEFPAGERALAFGLYGATNGLSVALGPILGGVLVQGIGWQAIFYVNVPIALVAFVMLQRKVVNLPGPPTQIDWPGLAAFSGALFLAVFATIRGNDEGWTSALILACYGAALFLGIAFVAIELRRKFPMFDLGLFRNPTFVGSSVSAFAVCFSMLALIFFLTTWLQSILGYSAVGTGLRMLVFTGAALVAAPAAGRMTATVSPRIVLPAGLALVAGGVLSMTAVSSSSSWTAILPGLVLAGLGLGMMNPTLASTAVSVVPPWRGGMASGMNSTCREAGTAAGIAVYGALLQHQVRVHVNSALAGSPLASIAKTAANAISSAGTPQLVHSAPAAFRPGLIAVAHLSYASGLRTVFVLGAIVAGVGALTALALVRKRHMIYAGEGGH
jgi:EmrB/QacA subfamily drug resistance transporter